MQMTRSPPLPDLTAAALPLKDALRGLRHSLRLGRRVIDLAPDAPDPMASVAGAALAGADEIASRVDRAASALSHLLLDPEGVGAAETLPAISNAPDDPRSATLFAAIAYRRICEAGAYLGTQQTFVSEFLLAEAFRTSRPSTTRDDAPGHFAAAILQEVKARHAARFALPYDPETGADPALVVSFALVLWLVAARLPDDPEDDASLLPACCDVARAVVDEVAEVIDDRDRLAHMIMHYADKV